MIPSKSRVLVQVTAPRFCAGLLIDANNICVEAAPILRWALGKRGDKLFTYFERKRWAYVMIWPDGVDGPAQWAPTTRRARG